MRRKVKRGKHGGIGEGRNGHEKEGNEVEDPELEHMGKRKKGEWKRKGKEGKENVKSSKTKKVGE